MYVNNHTAPAIADRDHVAVVAQHDAGTTVPQVTVIVSLYNYEKFVAGTLDTVRAQSLGALDLIVVNDCSTDGSLEVVKDWFAGNSSRFNRALLLHHQQNQGLAKTRNTAFYHARTPYVFVLDADNLLYPRCLERLLSALENCDASFAYCYLEHFGDVSALGNPKPWNHATFRHNNTIDAMVLMRKSVWEQAGGYSIMEVMGWEDFDLWFKIARLKGWGVHVHEILARYRVHGSSMLNTVTNPKVKILWAHMRRTYPEFF